VYIGGEHKAHVVQLNLIQGQFFFKIIKLNWVHFSLDFGEVIPSGTTQKLVCPFDSNSQFAHMNFAMSTLQT
jgi:hypothetical protein